MLGTQVKGLPHTEIIFYFCTWFVKFEQDNGLYKSLFALTVYNDKLKNIVALTDYNDKLKNQTLQPQTASDKHEVLVLVLFNMSSA